MPKKPGPKEGLHPKDEPLIFGDDATNSELDIEEFLEEWAPGTAVVEIYEKKKDGSRPHLERVGIEILREDLYGYLRENFGSGKFNLQFKDANRRIRKSIICDVGGPRRTEPASQRPQEGETFSEKMILALIASQKPPDFGAMFAGMAAVMGAIINGSKPSGPPTDPATMLQAVSSTFASLKAATGTGNSVKEAIELIAAAKELGGGNDGGDTWPGLIKDVGVRVLDVLRPSNGNGGSQPNAPPVVIPHNPAPLPAVASAGSGPQPNEAESPDMLLQRWLQTQIAFLKAKALAGKDVEFWVDYAFENQDEPGYAAIFEAMRRGVTFDHVLQFDPEIAANPILKTWFKTFYDEIHTGLFKQDAEPNAAMDSAGTGGDAPNLGGNAKSRP